jgi:hypothetical protein
MVMQGAGVGDAEHLRVHVEWSGGEGVDDCAVHAWRVEPEDCCLWVLQSWCRGDVGSLASANSLSMDSAAVVVRDIVCSQE